MTIQTQYVVFFMPFLFGLVVFLGGLTKLWTEEDRWWTSVLIGAVIMIAAVMTNFFWQ